MPNGEERSRAASVVEMLDMEKISLDPEFVNTRQVEDPWGRDKPATQGQSIESLMGSMREEGLKVAITVVDRGGGKGYWVRAGFRRFKCANNLKWKKIPATVLPPDTPAVDEQWANVLENTTRKALTTYEAACAAKLMRDKFQVRPAEFARKTGYSEGYVSQLLSCLEKLPPDLVEQWKLGASLTLREWYQLSLLDHFQATQLFRRWTGQSPSQRLKGIIERRDANPRNLAPAKFLDRMQKLYVGIEGSNLERKTRVLCLEVIEFCMGQKDRIKGVYEPERHGESERRAMLRRELPMPELPDPGTERETPPPPRLDAEEPD